MRNISIFLLALALIGCSIESDNNRAPSTPDLVEQGIVGSVEFWEGDFMPMVDGPAGGSITPVERTIYIHEPTGFTDVVPQGYGTLYEQILTPRVATVRSDSNGKFQVDLPVGKYSLFVEEEGGFYANSVDGSGHLSPVLVRAGEVAETVIKITYMATF